MTAARGNSAHGYIGKVRCFLLVVRCFLLVRRGPEGMGNCSICYGYTVMGLSARGGPGRDSVAERRVQLRVRLGQTDAVDQFVAREADGYKAEGFSRQRVLFQ